MKKYINLDFGGDYLFQERLTKIKARGFDGIFLLYDEYAKLEAIVKCAHQLNLDIETMHLPYKGCNNLWLDNHQGEEFKNLMIDGVIAASKLQIPTVIMHLIGGLNRPRPSELGLKRMQDILSVCETQKVNLAIENVRELTQNDYLFNHLSSPFLKMCFDFGHVNCFTKNTYEFPFANYKEYIMCCHIHDNNGEFDYHRLPFTGNVNFKYLVNKLKEIGYQGPLTSEARIKDNEYTDDDFIDKVYLSLTKIEQYFGENYE